DDETAPASLSVVQIHEEEDAAWRLPAPTVPGERRGPSRPHGDRERERGRDRGGRDRGGRGRDRDRPRERERRPAATSGEPAAPGTSKAPPPTLKTAGALLRLTTFARLKVCRWRSSAVEQLICNQPVGGSIPFASSNHLSQQE